MWRVVVSTCTTRYSARSYALNHRWDRESLCEVLQSWYEKRLIGKRRLETLLTIAEDARQLERLLTADLGQHIRTQHKSPLRLRLAQQTRRRLEEDPRFEAVGGRVGGQDQLWATRPYAERERPRRLHGLSAAAGRGPHRPLADLLERVLDAAEGPVCFADIVGVVVMELAQHDPASAETIDEVMADRLDVRDPSTPSPEDVILAKDAARRVLAQLTTPITDTVLALHMTGDRRSAAAKVGCDYRTVRNRVEHVVHLLSESLEQDACGHTNAELTLLAYRCLLDLIQERPG